MVSMATGLEIAACDVTSTAQVDMNPVVAVSPKEVSVKK